MFWQSHADNLQRALDDMKREHTYSNSGSDEDDDADLDYSAISGRQQNNHKAALVSICCVHYRHAADLCVLIPLGRGF
ncbi:hypothetical protein EON65_20730 [archaeon]|nr:MAG: hypothetical protein EON65_20730 [archaeon]